MNENPVFQESAENEDALDEFVEAASVVADINSTAKVDKDQMRLEDGSSEPEDDDDHFVEASPGQSPDVCEQHTVGTRVTGSRPKDCASDGSDIKLESDHFSAPQLSKGDGENCLRKDFCEPLDSSSEAVAPPSADGQPDLCQSNICDATSPGSAFSQSEKPDLEIEGTDQTPLRLVNQEALEPSALKQKEAPTDAFGTEDSCLRSLDTASLNSSGEDGAKDGSPVALTANVQSNSSPETTGAVLNGLDEKGGSVELDSTLFSETSATSDSSDGCVDLHRRLTATTAVNGVSIVSSPDDRSPTLVGSQVDESRELQLEDAGIVAPLASPKLVQHLASPNGHDEANSANRFKDLLQDCFGECNLDFEAKTVHSKVKRYDLLELKQYITENADQTAIDRTFEHYQRMGTALEPIVAPNFEEVDPLEEWVIYWKKLFINSIRAESILSRFKWEGSSLQKLFKDSIN